MIDIQKKFPECFENNILRKPLFIEKSGEYFVLNDIIIDFKPTYPTNNEILKLPSLRYGFFGGIFLIGDHIELNLLGHEIKMSESFALSQRFFSIIELTNSPFPLGGGLPLSMKKEDFKTGTFLCIKNGRLGRSSHSSIHGNENRNITISKLKMYDFEVGGVMMNGGKQISICKCNIGPNFQDLWVNAKFSAATQLIHHFYNVIPQENKKSSSFQELESLIEQTISAKTFDEIPLIFQNKEKVIDGTVYGISLHKSGVAIGGHGNNSEIEKEHFGFHTYLNQINIENLVGNVQEKTSLLYKDKVIRDISGQIIDFTDINTLVKVQLETKKWLEKYPNFKSTFFIPDDLLLEEDDTKLNQYIKENCIEKLGRDIMLHINKGVISCRLDGINSSRIDGLYIDNISNISKRNPSIENLILSNMEDVNEYSGNDTIGLCINNCYDLQGKNVTVEHLLSEKGTVYGVIIMNHSKHVYMDNISLAIGFKNKKQYGITLQDSIEDIFVKC